jgi:spoIIIJ-associated protein
MSGRFFHDGKLDRAGVSAELDRFLKLLLRSARLELSYRIEAQDPDPADVESPEILVTFSGRDQELLLAQQAELLRAIEYIALRWLKLDPQSYDRIRLESGDWRAMRLEELKLSAQVAAERVRQTRQPFRFNPMPARERRVLHLALKDQPGVRTSSEGVGDRRLVVVYPA